MSLSSAAGTSTVPTEKYPHGTLHYTTKAIATDGRHSNYYCDVSSREPVDLCDVETNRNGCEFIAYRFSVSLESKHRVQDYLDSRSYVFLRTLDPVPKRSHPPSRWYLTVSSSLPHPPPLPLALALSLAPGRSTLFRRFPPALCQTAILPPFHAATWRSLKLVYARPTLQVRSVKFDTEQDDNGYLFRYRILPELWKNPDG